MKLITVSLSFLFFIIFSASSTSANSNYKINMRANCFINGGANAVCEVCNYQFSRPILCQMTMRGLTSRRFFMNGQQTGVVLPGQCMQGFVYANNPYVDPLIDAQANVSCRF